MFSFEGDYRRKPVQAYGGASKKQTREDLILKTQEERLKREKLKQQQNGALKIQAWYRSARIRQLAKDCERQKFDTMQQFEKSQGVAAGVGNTARGGISGGLDAATLMKLTRQLIFFYDKTREDDGLRLAWLCWQMVIQKQHVIDRINSLDPGAMHQIKSFLRHCCRHIERVAGTIDSELTFGGARVNDGKSTLAMHLRALEIYTDCNTFNVMSDRTAANPAHIILKYLIDNGFYSCMRALVDHKIPSSIESQTSMRMDVGVARRVIAPPTATAASIMTLIQRPLVSLVVNSDSKSEEETLRSLASHFFCPRFSEQISAFILPSFVHASEDSRFPLVALLHALVPVTGGVVHGASGQSADSLPDLTVEPSIWLLLSVLSLAEYSLDKMTEADLRLLFLVLYRLSSQLSCRRRSGGGWASVRSGRSYNDNEEVDDTSDDDNIMQVDEPPTGLLDDSRARTDCIEKFDSPMFVRCVTRLVRTADERTLYIICALCHQLMAENKISVHRMRLLYSLAYNSSFLQKVWSACTSAHITGTTATQSLQMLSRGLQMSTSDLEYIVPLISVFSSFCSHFLLSLHDSEFHGDTPRPGAQMPFQLPVLAQIALTLCDVCIGIIQLTHPDTKLPTGQRQGSELTSEMLLYRQSALANVFKVTVKLIKHLHERDCRRQFCPDGHWISKHVTIRADRPSQIYNPDPAVFVRRPFGKLSVLNPSRAKDEEDLPMLTVHDVRNLTILTEMPFVVPFQDRVKIFHKMALKDKEDNQGGSLGHFGLGHSINIMVRRSHLYEDAFEKLSKENEPNLKLRMKVQLVNFAGLDEAGIDGGGIFREFMSELIKTSFDPNRGFFRCTADKLLYPNPQSKLLVNDYTRHYYFLGRILGKVLYENMLTELPFASFFLSKIISRERGNVDIHHLASLDPEMYKNLLFLKDYDGDVADLGLDFTVVNNELGEAQVEELKPGGRDVQVTNHNRIEYIHLMGHYRLNRQIRTHCEAFREGLADVVNVEWLTMFDHNELQVLISGAQIPIDIDNLKQHTNYSGGYTEDHDVIKIFWKVVEDFTDQQKRQLLKFVTSCSRPPLLGFKELYPAFCIHNAGAEPDRLPTASTCMNLLKLPEFHDMALMRQKLVYAIESGAGFELS